MKSAQRCRHDRGARLHRAHAQLDRRGAQAPESSGSRNIAINGDGANGLRLAELSELADPDAITAVMRRNLFRPISGAPGQFAPLHRTVAEFLGARWLARHVNRHPHARHLVGRIVGLVTAEGGVPSSLRGLHAWLPRFSPSRLGGDRGHRRRSKAKWALGGLAGDNRHPACEPPHR